jgi:para-aminobenzoate synthetase component 2
MTIALIDNYDSFTYNLEQTFGELGADINVFRDDEVTLRELIALSPTHLVISPGSGHPEKSLGISMDAIRYFAGKIPVLGVCFGHHCLTTVYGGKVDIAPRLMHGKSTMIKHNGMGIFKNIPSPFNAMCYHTLIVHDPLPTDLEITASTDEDEIMGVEHKDHPTFGVQFHPESISTEYGKQLLKNFLDF